MAKVICLLFLGALVAYSFADDATTEAPTTTPAADTTAEPTTTPASDTTTSDNFFKAIADELYKKHEEWDEKVHEKIKKDMKTVYDKFWSLFP